MHIHARARAHTRTHARTRARAHIHTYTHTQTHIYTGLRVPGRGRCGPMKGGLCRLRRQSPLSPSVFVAFVILRCLRQFSLFLSVFVALGGLCRVGCSAPGPAGAARVRGGVLAWGLAARVARQHPPFAWGPPCRVSGTSCKVASLSHSPFAWGPPCGASGTSCKAASLSHSPFAWGPPCGVSGTRARGYGPGLPGADEVWARVRGCACAARARGCACAARVRRVCADAPNGR
jgi:hypothetical protein